MQNLSRQVDSKGGAGNSRSMLRARATALACRPVRARQGAAPQTVQDVRQGAANAASGLTRKVLSAEVFLLADKMQRIILTLIRRMPAHHQPHDAGYECTEQDDDDGDA